MPEQVSKGAVVGGEGLRGLQEADQLEAIKALGAGSSWWTFGSRA